MDSLLEKKLENPRMNLEGERKIQSLHDWNVPVNVTNIKQIIDVTFYFH